MTTIPEHIHTELVRLIDEKLPVEQIAFMMRLDPEVVREEIARRDRAQEKRPA
jgi:hypothetical protein